MEAKKAYRKPELTDLGSVTDVTEAGRGKSARVIGDGKGGSRPSARAKNKKKR